VLAWRISNTPEADFCLGALNEAIQQVQTHWSEQGANFLLQGWNAIRNDDLEKRPAYQPLLRPRQPVSSFIIPVPLFQKVGCPGKLNGSKRQRGNPPSFGMTVHRVEWNRSGLAVGLTGKEIGF